MDQKRLAVALALIIASLAACVAWGAAPTGDEILARVDELGGLLVEGSQTFALEQKNTSADGTATTTWFVGLGKRTGDGSQALLLYLVEPADMFGTIFLFAREVDEARLWMYLPGLGIPKELVSENERRGSFAGSLFSYQDIAGRNLARDYRVDSVSEETLDVGGLARPVYVLSLSARPGAEVDFPSQTIWVDREEYLLLRVESRNSAKAVEETVEFLSLNRFEGQLIADQIVKSRVSGAATAITFLERRRPLADFPDALFDPGNLATFDPATYGLTAR